MTASRRNFLAGTVAAAAALPVAALAAPAADSKLAALARSYFEHEAAINATRYETDAALNADCDALNATLDLIADEPVRTNADALAALDVIESTGCRITSYEAARGPIEENVALIAENLREFLRGT